MTKNPAADLKEQEARAARHQYRSNAKFPNEDSRPNVALPEGLEEVDGEIVKVEKEEAEAPAPVGPSDTMQAPFEQPISYTEMGSEAEGENESEDEQMLVGPEDFDPVAGASEDDEQEEALRTEEDVPVVPEAN